MTGDGKALELSTELAACCLYLKSFCPTCRTQQGQQCTMYPERISCQACKTRRRCTDCSILPCTECNMAPSTAKRCARCHLRELLSRLIQAVTSSCSTTFHPTAHAVPLCAPPASGLWHSICSVSTHNSFVVDAVPSYSCSEVCSTLCEMRRRTRSSWSYIEMSQVVVNQVPCRAGPLHHWD